MNKDMLTQSFNKRRQVQATVLSVCLLTLAAVVATFPLAYVSGYRALAGGVIGTIAVACVVAYPSVSVGTLSGLMLGVPFSFLPFCLEGLSPWAGTDLLTNSYFTGALVSPVLVSIMLVRHTCELTQHYRQRRLPELKQFTGQEAPLNWAIIPAVSGRLLLLFLTDGSADKRYDALPRTSLSCTARAFLLVSASCSTAGLGQLYACNAFYLQELQSIEPTGTTTNQLEGPLNWAVARWLPIGRSIAEVSLVGGALPVIAFLLVPYVIMAATGLWLGLTEVTVRTASKRLGGSRR